MRPRVGRFGVPARPARLDPRARSGRRRPEHVMGAVRRGRNTSRGNQGARPVHRHRSRGWSRDAVALERRVQRRRRLERPPGWGRGRIGCRAALFLTILPAAGQSSEMSRHLLLLAPPPAHMIQKDPVLEAYQQEITYVFHALRWLGARPHEIEDFAQEVFIALRSAWPHYDSSRPLRPYLFGVAFRVSSMQRRKRKREVTFATLEIQDGGPGPDDALQAKQARATVLHAL